jgi:hypothetical protein
MNVSDRRYGSLRWKRLRLTVLNRDNYECQIRDVDDERPQNLADLVL